MRKLTLLIAAIAALGVMAVPAMAQAAPFWKVAGTKIGATPVAVSLSGSLTYTAPAAAGGIELGPCSVTGSGTIHNSATVGEDEITSFTIHAPCPTSIPGCEIAGAATNAEAGWPSVLGVGPTDTIGSESNPVAFVDVFAESEACASVGLAGEEVGAAGVVTGSFNNTTHSVVFSNAQGLFVPGIAESGKLNGSAALTTAGGAITVE